MSKPLILIQARLGSTRLPGKVVMRVGEASMVQMVQRRAGGWHYVAVPKVDEWRIATDDPARIICPAVPEDDVLARFFYASAIPSNPDPIIRLTADCPLIDPAVIQRALDEYDGTALVCSTKGPDYATGYPDGQDVEVFSREMLEEAFAKTVPGGNVYREHPTLWMRDHLPTHYLEHTPPVQIKLSVDTWDDLQFVRRIVRDLGPDCTLEEIYAWAAARPEHRPTVSG